MKMCPLWNGYWPTICKVAGAGLLGSRTKTAAAEAKKRLTAAAKIHLRLLPLRGFLAAIFTRGVEATSSGFAVINAVLSVAAAMAPVAVDCDLGLCPERRSRTSAANSLPL